MAFNYQAAVAAAQAVIDQQENKGNTNYKYPLVYPRANQTLTVRPLFNPASGQIVRLINRHEKVPCYKSYNIECPICKVMQEVKDTTGQDPFGRSKASRSRGIAFAQFISSSLPVEKSGGQPIQPGEIILFMFPWSVYSQINTAIQAIAQTPTGMDQAFSHANTGFYIQVQVDSSYKYTATQVPYMTFNSNMTDDEFINMLEGMDSLNDQVIPATITEDVDKQVKEYTDAIYRQYIAPRTQQSIATPQPTPVNCSTPPSPSTNDNTQPSCYGKHQSGSPKCITCPVEMTCMQESTSESVFDAEGNTCPW